MNYKIIILFVAILFVAFNANAQKMAATDSSAIVEVRTQAQFPKGAKGWSKFLKKKMDDFTAEPNYPQGDYELKVIISFKIDTSGAVEEVRVYRSCGNKKIDAYAVRVLDASPNWIPAVENGVKIRSEIHQSITFVGRAF